MRGEGKYTPNIFSAYFPKTLEFQLSSDHLGELCEEFFYKAIG